MAIRTQGGRTTLAEVALRAGVSTSTVSLVLANKAEQRRIPRETSERVRKAAEELNYSPNLLTRSLRRGRTHVLSYFSSFRLRDWGDVYMDRLSSAIETAGGELGYDVLVHCNYRRSLRETYQFLNGGMADGLLMFAPAKDDPLLAMLRDSPLPVVIVNGQDPMGQYSAAHDDVEQGIELVAERLVSLGHRRIGALGTVGRNVRDSELRIQLLGEALRRRGLALDPQYVAWADARQLEPFERMMELPEPPTALFCWHDLLAYRTLEACDSIGIRVPDQLSIIGYDGVHWPSVSQHICASIEVDISAIARASVRLLDQTIRDPATLVQEEVIPVSLSAGTTLAPPSVHAMEQP